MGRLSTARQIDQVSTSVHWGSTQKSSSFQNVAAAHTSGLRDETLQCAGSKATLGPSWALFPSLRLVLGVASEGQTDASGNDLGTVFHATVATADGQVSHRPINKHMGHALEGREAMPAFSTTLSSPV